jgi:hypothetical protein
LNQGSFPPDISFAHRRRDFLDRQAEFRRILEMRNARCLRAWRHR